jgi:hypothetical protein
MCSKPYTDSAVEPECALIREASAGKLFGAYIVIRSDSNLYIAHGGAVHWWNVMIGGRRSDVTSVYLVLFARLSKILQSSTNILPAVTHRRRFKLNFLGLRLCVQFPLLIVQS